MKRTSNPSRVPPHALHSVLLVVVVLLCCIPPLPAGEVYRWQDTHGTTIYSDTAPPGTTTTRITLDPSVNVALVEHVIDGDTVILKGGERVRLLGINTPEVAHRNRPGETLGDQARQALHELVSGKRVILAYEKEQRDHYGRLLAHLFLEDGRHLNALLIETGWGHVSLHWPNLQYGEQFLRSEQQARTAGRGIWSLEQYQLQPVSKAKERRNRFTRLQGHITRVDERHGDIRLHFGKALTITVRRKHRERFTEAGIALAALGGTRVVVRGWVGHQKGMPHLYLEHPWQLESYERR